MTERERETLAIALAEQRAFRAEMVDRFNGVDDKLDSLDTRLRPLEEAQAVVIALDTKKKESRLSLRAWLAIAVAATGIATSVVMKVFEVVA